MTADSRTPSARKFSWKESRDPAHLPPLSKTAKRWLATCGVAILAAALIYVLYRWAIVPGRHSYVAVAPLLNYHAPQIPPNAFADEDAHALAALVGEKHFKRHEMQTLDDMVGLASFFKNLPAARHDSLLVYVSGHGVSRDGSPLLLPSDAWERQDKLVDKCHVARLLDGLEAVPASHKLLLLDSGRLDYDPRLGMLVNEFPRLVAEHMAERKQDCWVLLPADVFQTTLVDYSAKRSVFGALLERAFEGEADDNRDAVLSLRELYTFVSRGLAPYGQTPLLLQGGRGRVSSAKIPEDIELLRIARKKPAKTEQPIDPKKEVQKIQEQKAKIQQTESTIKSLPNKALPGSSSLWQVAPPSPAAAPPDKQPPGAPAGADAKRDAAAPAETGPSATASEPKETPVETAPQKPAPPGELSLRGRLHAALGETWETRDRLARQRDAGLWQPRDYAPHRWRDLEATLLDLERRARGGSFYETALVLHQLEGVSKELGLLARAHEPGAPPSEGASERFADDTLDIVRKLGVAHREFVASRSLRSTRTAVPADGTALARARRVHQAALYEAPDFLRWQYAEVLLAGERQQLSLAELEALLETSASLQGRLDALERSEFDDSARESLLAAANAVEEARLALHRRLEARAGALIEKPATSTQDRAARQRGLEALLSTPLPTAELRGRLLLALLVPLMPEGEPSASATSMAAAPNPPWGELQKLLSLHVKVLELCEPVLSKLRETDPNEERRERSGAARQKSIVAELIEIRDRLESETQDEGRFAAYRAAGLKTQEAQQGMAQEMRRSFGNLDLAATARGLWFVDARDARPLAPEMHSLASLTVKRRRALAFGPDASTLELAEEWRTFDVPVVAISLNSAEGDQAEFRLRYDESRLEVRHGESPNNLNAGRLVPVSIEELLGGTLRLRVRARQAAASGASPSTELFIELAARNPKFNELQPAPLRVECRLPSPERISLHVQRVDSSSRQRGSGAGLQLEPFANRETAFQFWLVNSSGRPRKVSIEWWSAPPVPEATWAPGRLVVAGNQVPAVIRQELFKDLSARVMKMRADLDPERLLSQTQGISLPAEANPVEAPFTAWPPARPEPAPGEPPAAAAPLPPTRDISHGLVCVITDDEQPDRQWIEWIEILPLRPERLLNAKVQYNSADERAQVEVSLKEDFDNDDLPDRIPGLVKLPLAVELEIDESQFGDGEKKRRVEFVRAGETQLLYASARRDNLKRRLALSVDGYPRALRYEVPCDAGGRDQTPINTEALRIVQLAAAYTGEKAPASEELQAAREAIFSFATESPNRRAMFPAPATALRVQFEADLPPSAFVHHNGRDAIELRLRGQDRQVARFYADRQATTRLHKLSADGVLTLRCEVNDYSVSVPTAGLGNARFDLDAALYLDGTHRLDARPIDVLLDGAPPRVSRPTNIKTHSPDGKAVFLLAEVQADDNLSGVQKVEVGIDKNRNREIDKEDPFHLATATRSGGIWQLEWDLTKLELSPGQRYELFVRATDRVGWVGKPPDDPAGSFIYPRPVDLAPKVFGVVKGTIKLGDKPVTKERATLTLRIAEPERVITQKAFDDGSYVIRDVPAGRHKLTVTGEFLGSKFFEQLEVEIPATGAPEVTLDIKVSPK